MSQAPTPKLNLRRLEGIQRLLQYAGALVLGVFVVLIGLSAWQLRRINSEIEIGKAKLQALAKTTEALSEVTRKSENQNQVKAEIERSLGEVSDGSTLPPRIYMQIAREDQRKYANNVARQLQNQGYVVPGIETVQKGPDVSSLRYYQTDDAAQKALAEKDLKDISALLRNIGVDFEVPPPFKSSGVRSRHYEIWFGNDFPGALAR